MLYALGVLIFAVGLLLSIALHEVGHMVPAKKFGVKVTQYMVGFGPTIWSRTKGDTEYGVKAVPLGGYIKMIGMVPPRQNDGPSRWPRRMATAIEEFRSQSRETLDPQDEHREFYRLTPGKKMIVMFSGPFMNLVIFLVLMTILLMGVGLRHDDATTTIKTVSRCLADSSDAAAVKACEADDAPLTSPAAVAGLLPGDRVLSVDGTPITSFDQLVKIIEPSVGTQLHLVIERNGKQLDKTVTPARNQKQIDSAGHENVETGMIGVEPTSHIYYGTLGITEVPGQIGRQISDGFSALGKYPAKVGSLFRTVFDGQQRDPNGAIGVVGIGRIGGEIADDNQVGIRDKVAMLIGLLAGVNLLLFFFNLVPLLPLDGGHIAGAAVEAVRRGWARFRGRSAKGIFVDTAQTLPVIYAVGSVLIVLTLLTLYADIVDPVSITGG